MQQVGKNYVHEVAEYQVADTQVASGSNSVVFIECGVRSNLRPSGAMASTLTTEPSTYLSTAIC